MARTAIAILTPRARRANVSRWVEAMERGRKPHANIPMETSIDTGTHPTCSADVLPIPCCTNRSGPTGPGSFPTPPISDRAARTVQTALLACAAAGYVRGGLRPRAGMWDLCEPAPASKKTARALECGSCASQRPRQRKPRALECGSCASQRPRQRKPRARWNVGPVRASARVKETARVGKRKNSTRTRVKETACARECLQNPACE